MGCARAAHPRLVKRLSNGSITTYLISARSVQPIPRYGKGAHLHVRMWRCTPPSAFVKRLANEIPNYTPNFSAIDPAVSELRKRGTSARAHVLMYPTHDLLNMHRWLVSKHIPNLVTIGPAIPGLLLSDQFWHPSRGGAGHGWAPNSQNFLINYGRARFAGY